MNDSLGCLGCWSSTTSLIKMPSFMKLADGVGAMFYLYSWIKRFRFWAVFIGSLPSLLLLLRLLRLYVFNGFEVLLIRFEVYVLSHP